MYNNCIYNYFEMKPQRRKLSPVRPGNCRIEDPKPRTSYYHYTNDESQGALICETPDFPDQWKLKDIHEAYSDRMQMWDAVNYDKACKLAGTGEQGWSYALPRLGHDALCEFAKVALKLDKMPKHVRIIHYYNVSNGYSCPVVMALT